MAAYVGFQSPAVMLLAFLPMLFIAAAYYYLNRADPDCGTTFTWVTRAMGPKTGWMAGWGILMTDLVVMPNLASIAGVYTFSLFGAHGIAADSSGFWVTFVGVVWLIVMTLICYIGIELSAATQVALLGAEILILMIFSVIALVKVYTGHIAHAVRPSFEWLNPFKIHPIGALSAGMLLAVFIYWGWDTAVTVNEEVKDTRRTPGRAALWSTLVLLAIYVIVSFAAQSFKGTGFLTNQNNIGDVLNALGDGGPRVAVEQAADHLRAHLGVVLDPDDHLACGAFRAVDGRAQGVSEAIRRHPLQIPVPGLLDVAVRGDLGRLVRVAHAHQPE